MTSHPGCAGGDLHATWEHSYTASPCCMYIVLQVSCLGCSPPCMFPTTCSIQLQRQQNPPGRHGCEMALWEDRGHHEIWWRKVMFSVWSWGQEERGPERPWREEEKRWPMSHPQSPPQLELVSYCPDLLSKRCPLSPAVSSPGPKTFCINVAELHNHWFIFGVDK